MKNNRSLLYKIGITVLICLMLGHGLYSQYEFKSKLQATTFDSLPAWGKVNSDGTYSFYEKKYVWSHITTVPLREAAYYR